MESRGNEESKVCGLRKKCEMERVCEEMMKVKFVESCEEMFSTFHFPPRACLLFRKVVRELTNGIEKSNFHIGWGPQAFSLHLTLFLGPTTFTSHHYLIYLFFTSLPLTLNSHLQFHSLISVNQTASKYLNVIM